MGPVSFETIVIPGDDEAVRRAARRVKAAGVKIERMVLPTTSAGGTLLVRSAHVATARAALEASDEDGAFG